MPSIDGLVSGFDTTTIIESLLGFQQAQIDNFNVKKAEISSEQAAFKGIEAGLISIRSSLTRLNRTQNSVFDIKVASSSDEDILTAAASGDANPGVYQLTVDSLASAEQLASQGFATTSDSIGTGDISFSVGNRPSETVTIDASNNTVTGLVSSINDQLEDVSASLIFDQGSGTYRILLSSNHTGADNQITINSTLSGGTAPDFSGPAVQEAANAVITLGSGPGAISAEFETNQVDNLIEDVTLDLKSASPGTTVTVSISSDTTAAQEAIESFVSDFNSVVDYIAEQTRFVPDANIASPLLGNRSVSSIKNNLLGAVTESIISDADLSRLSQIGIDVNTSGKLVLNSGTLSKALNGELDGVDPTEIRYLFGLNASSDNAGIQFLTGSSRTKDSSTAYQVDITQAAEQATITATSALSSSIVINGTNNELRINVDSVDSESLYLSEGTYTREELAAHIQSVINGSDELGVHNVTVGLSASDELVITTEAYGTAAHVSNVSGTSSATLGFTSAESDYGLDVVGSFYVDGVQEIATGTGRVLSGDRDNANTADLQVLVTLASSGVVAGTDANLQVSRGVSGRLDVYINQILDAETGLLKTVDEDFKARIASIDESISRVEDITETKRQFLIAEFTALESIIAELQNTGNIIASQLQTVSAFNNNNNNRNN